MSRARQALGARGEAMAAAWYERNGYTVLARNWRCRDGELDLIVHRGRTIVFCEVKSRSSSAFGVPVEAVTYEKRRRIRHLAARWLEEEAPFRPREIRFDVASILAGRLEVLEGAF
ncbi:YraN family protein [Rhabdothermincola sediminis]|uniref:YraN family protein n=1 Tax=Rhabdothermincola sediminis TaxID=2751370 RepID=UPI001AA03F69|nr:YraN family protein [Rhabdothermincola sediminis]